ncbi:MAG: hypothetical protein U5O39_13620 [Gammaproteobacteria bacterium]|nr:hypothetical protein [Gammaproteobacteria bacterium]
MKARGESAGRECSPGTGIAECDLAETESRVSYRARIRQLENVIEMVPPRLLADMAGGGIDLRLRLAAAMR